MYKALLRAFPIEIPSAIARRLNITNSVKVKRTKMETSYDFNRRWTPILGANGGRKSINNNKAATFKLVSYNILAQDLLLEHLYLYQNIQQEFLTWRRRQQNLQRELIRLNPDILCLQEIQFDHLAPFIQGLGMGSGRRLAYVYKKKTGQRTDGCAIVYDSTKFQLLDQQAVELHDPDVALLNREMVALFAKFRFKNYPTPKEFVVATTHLLYNPKRSDVRCAQLARTLRELSTFATDDTPVVLTGDFNSEIFSSPIQLLIGEEGRKEACKETDTMRFDIIDPGEGTVSTYQDNWITVDYILRSLCSKSKHKLLPISVYSLPTIQACFRVGKIPNHYLGSDHYATGAIFSVI
ncbi:protein angel [Drosophila kikkawai]|uniref:Protein angel n=1 Tax=Drosophila kikkawai TaxID=30033 RepID=A0A6P4IPG1_DROKI|nr:protein angel [Drosophila kikkawai]